MSAESRKILNMVLAVLVSLGAWVYVVYNYDPMTEVNYSDVTVSFTGETGLAERGLAVEEADVEGIGVSLRQRRVDSGRISSDEITVSADVSGCSAGENNVSLSVKSPDDTSVIGTDRDSVEVTVGRAKRRVFPVKVVYAGEAPEDEEPIALDLSVAEAEVACTEERLNNIDRIVAELERDEVSESIRSFSAKLTALDKDGNEMQHVVIYPDEISLDACEGYVKTVRLNVPVKNSDDENYERKYTVPETVTIKGPKDIINKTGSVTAKEIDIRYYYEDAEIPIEYELPEGVYPVDGSQMQNLRLTVTEKEKEEEEDEDQ